MRVDLYLDWPDVRLRLSHIFERVNALCVKGDAIESDVQLVARALEQQESRLKRLSWIDSSCRPPAFSLLVDALGTNQSLTVLELTNLRLCDDDARALATALARNNTLTTLGLNRNRICTHGAEALATALARNNTLKTLVLDCNCICAQGAAALADMLLSNCSLRTLSLANNLISKKGAVAFSKALRANCALQTLDIAQNHIGNAGAMRIVKALRCNTALRSLSIGAEHFRHAQKFEKYLGQNITLQKCDFYFLMNTHRWHRNVEQINRKVMSVYRTFLQIARAQRSVFPRRVRTDAHGVAAIIWRRIEHYICTMQQLQMWARSWNMHRFMSGMSGVRYTS